MAPESTTTARVNRRKKALASMQDVKLKLSTTKAVYDSDDDGVHCNHCRYSYTVVEKCTFHGDIYSACAHCEWPDSD